jgi:hypothetical protein
LAVIGTLLVDEGEIVILETHGADRIYTTQLWIVELDGVRYLRSGRSDTDWLARLQASPEVALRATDAPHVEASPYRALPVNDADLRERVNRAMAEKYGFSDVIWSWVVDRSGAVAIRLEPLAEQSASAEAGSVR